MNIFIGQIYADPVAWFPFTTSFQKLLGEQISKRITPSKLFCSKFGTDYRIVFRMSAKVNINNHEIKGPKKYPKSKTVEFSVFLAYDQLSKHQDWKIRAVTGFLDCVIDVLRILEIDTNRIQTESADILKMVFGMKDLVSRESTKGKRGQGAKS